jgi:tellurite resistance protein TehA-like permease
MVPNIIGWISMSFVTSVPPLVVGAMPNGNAYPLFIFFAAYGLFAYVLLQFYMRESKDKTYEQIIDSF